MGHNTSPIVADFETRAIHRRRNRVVMKLGQPKAPEASPM
jgi:hypothetical protein